MKTILKKLKKEAVFTAAFILALISCFIIKPDVKYLSYVDLKVIALLFSLMAVVAGLKSINVFTVCAEKIISKASDMRELTAILLALPFFLSALITNDVALITFVPFAIETLRICSKEDKIIYIVVLQSIFANIGSMFTPMGNPQNLYIYSYYGISAVEFLKITLPVFMLSCALLIICLFPVKREKLNRSNKSEYKINKKFFIFYMFFAILALAAVFISKQSFTFFVALLIFASVFIFDRNVLKNIDWFLLLTFICFFIFVGNAGRIDSLRSIMESAVKGHEFICSVILSQFISNVPCAVMLSGFTKNYAALLLGVNTGGLGTLVASLASLIAFRLYSGYKKADKKKYLLFFSAANLIFLLILSAFCSIMLYKYF